MRSWIHTAWILAIAIPLGAGAQPTGLYTCLEGGGLIPSCAELGIGSLIDLDCGQSFAQYRGRVAWFPLRCIGPITIEVNARARVGDRYPLYVEIDPMGNDPCFDPGYVVMVAHGGFTCHYWESVGPIDITPFVPLGSSYAVQVVFFESFSSSLGSPALDCFRVTAHPVTSALSNTTWGLVKNLFR